MSSAPDNGQTPASVTAGPVLEVRDLAVEYASERGSVRAVDGVSFDLDAGEFIAVRSEEHTSELQSL